MNSDRLSSNSAATLWLLYREVLAELKRRGVLRSTGGPVGDYGDYLVVRALRLKRASYPSPAYDAAASDGLTYSIKARRWGRTERPTRVQVGSLVGHPFDPSCLSCLPRT